MALKCTIAKIMQYRAF